MSPRMSAERRRTEIVRIALANFANGGYKGTSTEAIAAEAGISQPYLFRLFGTKRELFIACVAECYGRVQATFETAAADVPVEQRFAAMGAAYAGLLEDRTVLLFQMQSYAACADEVIRGHVRDGYRGLFAAVQRLTGAPAEEVWAFFGQGMLLNVVASIDLPIDEAKFIHHQD